MDICLSKISQSIHIINRRVSYLKTAVDQAVDCTECIGETSVSHLLLLYRQTEYTWQAGSQQHRLPGRVCQLSCL